MIIKSQSLDEKLFLIKTPIMNNAYVAFLSNFCHAIHWNTQEIQTKQSIFYTGSSFTGKLHIKKNYFPWFYDETDSKIGLYVKSWADISPPITTSYYYPLSICLNWNQCRRLTASVQKNRSWNEILIKKKKSK